MPEMLFCLLLGGSTPLLICRSAFGWKLIRANARSSQSRFSVEDLILTTAAIASVLFMCRVPQIATERPPNVLYINLSRTKITYDGLGAASFAHPQRIQIALGQFSIEEVRELKKSLPLVVGKSDD